MDTRKILKELKNKRVLLLPVTELEALLKNSEIISENDTIVNGKVRILKTERAILFQEVTAKDELALRKFSHLKDAQELVNDRLAIYENMWNGCGCKVKYYE